MRLLVVDDSSTMRRIIKNHLKSIGLDDVVEAEDGKGALSRLETGDVDLVITDWNMPVMNGLELVTSMRSVAQWKSTPVLMITTSGERDDVLRAMEAGVTNYIVKPFDAALLKKKVNEIMGT